MFSILSTLLLMVVSTPDSSEIVPVFIDSILTGKTEAAADMISIEAYQDIDSVMQNDPETLISVLQYFGIQLEEEEAGSSGGRELIVEVLSSPSVIGGIMLFGVSPEDPLSAGGRLFVPASYGMGASRDTIYIQIVEEDSQWKLRDFFEDIP